MGFSAAHPSRPLPDLCTLSQAALATRSTDLAAAAAVSADPGAVLLKQGLAGKPPPRPLATLSPEVEAAERAARAAPPLSDGELKAAAGAKAVHVAAMLRAANGHGPGARAATHPATERPAAAAAAAARGGAPPTPAADELLLSRPALSTDGLTARLGHPPGPGDGPVHHPSHGHSIHVIFTSNGAPSLNWQTRVLAATLGEVREMAFGDRLAGFTRILHRSSDDALVGEVPTFRASPLTPACDAWCEHPVGDRPDAVRQFFDAARVEKGLVAAPWVYLIEPDYLFVKPIAAPLAETTGLSYGFPLPFLNPMAGAPAVAAALARLWPGGDLAALPTAGPAPALLRAHEWVSVLPAWVAAAAAIEADPEAKAALGPSRELHAFALAAAQTGLRLDLTPPPSNLLIAQPPLDEDIGDASAYHYSWGVRVVEGGSGKVVWAWDKRAETGAGLVDVPPTIPLPPGPWREGWVVGEEGTSTRKNVSRALYDTLRSQATTLNRASAAVGGRGGGRA
jgi:hypothetical protein